MATSPDNRAQFFRLIDRLGVNRLAFAKTKASLRILCYHGAWTVSRPHFGNKLFIGRETFRQRLGALAAQRCNVLPLLEALDGLRSGTLPPRAVAITIDDGWASTFEFMLPELLRCGFPATLYLQTQGVLSGAPVHDVAIAFAIATTPVRTLSFPAELGQGALVKAGVTSFALDEPGEDIRLSRILNAAFDDTPECARKELLQRIFEVMQIRSDDLIPAFSLGTPDDIRIAAANGFEVALHTHTHSLGNFSPDAIRTEIGANQDALGAILGRPPASFRHFCWPNGEYTEQAMAYLAMVGVDVATSCDFGLATASSDPLHLPRILDGELTSTAEFLTMLSGLKYLAARTRAP